MQDDDALTHCPVPAWQTNRDGDSVELSPAAPPPPAPPETLHYSDKSVKRFFWFMVAFEVVMVVAFYWIWW